MLSTVLAAYPWLAPSLLAAVVVVGPFVAWALAGWRRAATALAVAAIVVVGLLTLWPSGIAALDGCELSWSPNLLAPEPLANVVLLVPVGLLLAVATRQPILAALLGAVLAAGIELTQAIVPAVGRSCTLDDWVANAIGSVLGAALGAIGVALADWRRRERAHEHRHAGR
ncbi:VanZ family protein [Agrococcus jejuensis]|uniref:VanZ like family protein n=1 Tax=Agrococcus jejuensis TaxID=399736 RepID=A0A1G8EPF3_9MICO|nr:VanZ family protein [Agrococcus jejuensis]SDH71748.1 VanZ like family protein [Agrococcus jejuensis]